MWLPNFDTGESSTKSVFRSKAKEVSQQQKTARTKVQTKIPSGLINVKGSTLSEMRESLTEKLTKVQVQYKIQNVKKQSDLQIQGAEFKKLDIGVRTNQPGENIEGENYFDESSGTLLIKPIADTKTASYQVKEINQIQRSKPIIIKTFLYGQNASKVE